MKCIKLFLLLLFLNSCSKNYTPVAEYKTFPVKFAKTKIAHPSNDFSMVIPKNWMWEKEEYEEALLSLVAASSDSTSGDTSIIEVFKYRSLQNNTTLAKEYESYLRLLENKRSLEIVECGKTKLNTYDAYVVHSHSTHEHPIEIIAYLVKGKEQGVFYSLTANCPLEEELKTNMGMMVKCMNSFRYN